MILTRGPLLAALLAVTLAASAAPLKTDTAKSAITANFKQMNVPVAATFRTFSAKLDYDPARPAAASAAIEIDTASLDLGDPDMNKEVAKKDWFNSAQFPKATFVSSEIKAAGAGKLNVTGKLTIKGKSATVTFPATVRAEGGKQLFEGALPIRRLAYNIGDGEWKDTSMVADEVVIRFRVLAGQ
ncbi:YceI family protein [Massilia soli]|uniref:YceI family protein n=1 Tax=Massilia soli TaxID=2792854 RepID=A0ABS7SPC2_9BURK|nr:YceI family protein [Massilia soli]MBZ2208041.1 YceI family protein [Massilia soli]